MDFKELVGKQKYGTIEAQDYITWAEDVLLKDVSNDTSNDISNNHSENIAILAGLGLDKTPDSQEVEFYFNKCVTDLGLIIKTDDIVLKEYAIILCEQLIHGEVKTEIGVDKLSGLFYSSDYQEIYGLWSDLNDDIWSLEYDGQAYFNSTLSKQNKDVFVKDMAKQFIELLHCELPDNFYKLHFCKKCENIAEFKIKPSSLSFLSTFLTKLLRPLLQFFWIKTPTNKVVCSHCENPYPLAMTDFNARQRYLSVQSKQL